MSVHGAKLQERTHLHHFRRRPFPPHRQTGPNPSNRSLTLVWHFVRFSPTLTHSPAQTRGSSRRSSRRLPQKPRLPQDDVSEELLARSAARRVEAARLAVKAQQGKSILKLPLPAADLGPETQLFRLAREVFDSTHKQTRLPKFDIHLFPILLKGEQPYRRTPPGIHFASPQVSPRSLAPRSAFHRYMSNDTSSFFHRRLPPRGGSRIPE